MPATLQVTDATRLGLSRRDAHRIKHSARRLTTLAHGALIEYRREFTPGGSTCAGFRWEEVDERLQRQCLRCVKAAIDHLARDRPCHHRDPRNTQAGLNVYDDDRAPGWRDMWEEQHPELQLIWLRVAKDFVMGLVVDYITKGCHCTYCELPPDKRHGHGKPLMCTQRWRALSRQAQQDICESVGY
jgi:hypothetical protein